MFEHSRGRSRTFADVRGRSPMFADNPGCLTFQNVTAQDYLGEATGGGSRAATGLAGGSCVAAGGKWRVAI